MDEKGKPDSVDVARVARAAPPPRSVINRRAFVLTGFWGSIAAVATAIVGGWGIDFLWPKKLAGFGAPVAAKAAKVPEPGTDPVHIAEGRFWLVNVAPGEGESPGGLLAFYQKCPHLGCSVPWRPEFDFGGKKGWFRCPCHGSTFTREGGILVAGPSSRNMDTMAITVKPNGDITVQTSQVKQGGADNPFRAVPYPGQGG
jgi:cytochrome b6-f complex iron-sulfur subunit